LRRYSTFCLALFYVANNNAPLANTVTPSCRHHTRANSGWLLPGTGDVSNHRRRLRAVFACRPSTVLRTVVVWRYSFKGSVRVVVRNRNISIGVNTGGGVRTGALDSTSVYNCRLRISVVFRFWEDPKEWKMWKYRADLFGFVGAPGDNDRGQRLSSFRADQRETLVEKATIVQVVLDHSKIRPSERF